MKSVQLKRSESSKKRLASLTTHLRNYEKPKPNGYDLYATSYISSDIPWTKLDQNVSEPADLPPFRDKFEITHFALQKDERQLRGGSERKAELLEAREKIEEQLGEAKRERSDYSSEPNIYLAYLYFKAMQYSEVNKALAFDERYPKPECDVIRSTYSKEHQAAIKATRLKGKDSAATLEQGSGHLVPLPEVVLRVAKETRRMASKAGYENVAALRKAIREAIGLPLLVREMKLQEKPWQFKASMETRKKEFHSKGKKLPWKRNVYPPRTREERIAALRAKTVITNSEYWETDHLPGIWHPELMIPEFKTSYIENKEKRLDEYTEEDEDWMEASKTNKKCLDWLKSIPDSL